MQALNLPTYSFNIKSEEGRKFIFDVIRKKFVVLTPEEWVRQNFIHYLNNEKHYPLQLMSVETAFKLYKSDKRSDIAVYNRKGEPVAMVECKAPEIKIDSKVFDQIIRYNLKFKLKFIMVTNGLYHFCCRLDYQKLTSDFQKEIPDYELLNKG
jgi:hypothetical protein